MAKRRLDEKTILEFAAAKKPFVVTKSFATEKDVAHRGEGKNTNTSLRFATMKTDVHRREERTYVSILV